MAGREINLNVHGNQLTPRSVEQSTYAGQEPLVLNAARKDIYKLKGGNIHNNFMHQDSLRSWKK
jgi:hypothetical protein